MHNQKENNRYLLRSVVAMAVAITLPAAAQQRGVLEEIVVTAEHREASLQETTISLSAFSADAIAELGISNGLDIGQHVPNLNAQPYVGGRTGISYNIRGIGESEVLASFDPAVSVYLDGVLIAKNVGSLLDVLELERIEVLRGPQGTLYGRNTMGGAVNYITKKPSEEFEGRVKVTLGNYDQRDIRAMINVPLLGDDSGLGVLNLRASAASLNRDGIQDNQPSFLGASPEKELGTKDRDVAMLQLEWRPADTLSANYTYDRTRIDEKPETPSIVTVNPQGLPVIFGIDLSPFEEEENDRPRNVTVNDPHTAETEVDGHALNLSWDVGENLTFQSLTGYREMRNLGYADADGSPFSLIFTRDKQGFDSFSQEFRFVGATMNNRLDYSVGLYYFDEEGELYSQTDVFGGPLSTNIAEFSNDALAVYGQATYAFTDRFDATFGIRYTEEDREMDKAILFTQTGLTPILTLDQVRATTPEAVFPSASGSFENVSPMVSASYDWTDDIMTYAKVSAGYQSGGFNARDETPQDFITGFEEETILAYELGMKALFADRYQINAAWFFSDYDDKRVNQFNPETLASVQKNAGAVEIWGVELELLAQLTDNFQAGLNYGHIDPEYVVFDVPDPANPEQTIDLSNTANFPFAPENSYSAFLAYEYSAGFGLLRARLDWSYRDEMTFLVPSPERNLSKNANLWNARLTLDELAGPGDTRMRISAWVKNLTDEGYWNFGVNLYDSLGFDFNTYGEPRTFGVDLEVAF